MPFLYSVDRVQAYIKKSSQLLLRKPLLLTDFTDSNSKIFTRKAHLYP